MWYVFFDKRTQAVWFSSHQQIDLIGGLNSKKLAFLGSFQDEDRAYELFLAARLSKTKGKKIYSWFSLTLEIWLLSEAPFDEIVKEYGADMFYCRSWPQTRALEAYEFVRKNNEGVW